MNNQRAIKILQKVKYDQWCYSIVPPCNERDCPFNGGHGNSRCDNYGHCGAYIEPFRFRPSFVEGYGKTWFDNLDKAKEKLKTYGKRGR